eukprot:TRINITY_DN1239_c0_g1_i1.p1 TRINITY_DN1239_c0_g1~~TRINITY_DN1239_c0_g1_i1.p1  ORF type:complete len:303 (-),score=42.07 TRINITY_DN1239_c0_g1_i1:101-1009(-)
MEKAEAKSGKLRWGELEDEDNEDLGFLLPPPRVIGPDENGVKKIIEFKFNEHGQKIKKITTTRVRKVAKLRISKRALERREWRKFGDAVNESENKHLTMISTEEIRLERPRPPGSQQEDVKAAGDPLAMLASKGGAGAMLMVCRICGKKGDHWTSKCPYKDLAPQGTESIGLPTETVGNAAAPAAAPAASGKNTYVPPSLRGGPAAAERGAEGTRRRNDENSVRVTNLSEDTRESDLHELFKPFGNITRVYVAVDQRTGVSRGFGFVNFMNREDAQRAINKLNGYGYDNLILRVEWATPRQN